MPLLQSTIQICSTVTMVNNEKREVGEGSVGQKQQIDRKKRKFVKINVIVQIYWKSYNTALLQQIDEIKEII